MNINKLKCLTPQDKFVRLICVDENFPESLKEFFEEELRKGMESQDFYKIGR